MNKIAHMAIVATAISSLFLTGCETPEGTAALGALTGAAIGGASQGGWTGAGKGALIGAGAGYLGGVAVKKEREARATREYSEPVYRGTTTSYPRGTPTSRSGYVRSPYYPNNLIDVSGVPRGARVIDPSTDRVFINP